MTSLSVAAYAKINLTLDVQGRRADGYHDIRSIMQTVLLRDTLTVTHTPDTPGVHLVVEGDEAEGVPADKTNIVHRAAVRLQEVAAARGTLPGNQSGLHITLTKRIPSQAGLGGGSSDAAATLRAVDTLFGLHLSPSRLAEIAASLGADVPFFLVGGTALVEGLGERVTPRPPLLPAWWVVIVKPPVGVSTARAYAALDAVPDRQPGRATDAWDTPRFWGQRLPLGNDFQARVLAEYPEIALAYDAVAYATTGYQPLLCGSGSALFSLVRGESAAHLLADYLLGVRVGKVWVATLPGRDE